MKVDERHLTERSGVSEVQHRVTNQLNWLFREQPTSDFGIDAQIEVVRDGQATGRLLAAQIKSGPSFFTEPTTDGYVYRGDKEHLDYWLNHSLPVIVVMWNPQTGECLWKHISESAVERTPKGWKTTVLRTHNLGRSSMSALDQAAGALLARLRELYDRTTACRMRYWDIPKDERIRVGLRPEALATGYWGTHVIELGEEVLAKALRAVYPIECESIYAHVAWGGPRSFADGGEVIAAIEPMIADLEKRLNDSLPAAPLATSTGVALGNDETAALLRVMVGNLPARSVSLTYDQIVEACHPRVGHEAIRRVLPTVVKGTNWRCTLGEATVTLEYTLPRPPPTNTGGWSPSRDGFGGF